MATSAAGTTAKTDRTDKKSDAAAKSDPPPDTMADLLKLLLQPSVAQPPPAQIPTARSVAQPEKTPAQTTGAAPAASVVTVRPKPTTAPTVILSSSVVPAQVLAVNPDAASLRRAQDLGFTVGPPTDLAQLGMRIFRLAPPPGIDSINAEALLGQSPGGDVFALNRVYRPYRAATAESLDTASDGERVRPAGSGGCGPQRCYGVPAIGWRQDLQSCAKGLNVGIIDTWVDHRHPTFEDSHVQVGTIVSEGRKPAVSPHGTGVLAILAGSPRSGTPGLIPDAAFFVADIFHADGNGQALADTLALLKALDWMEAWGVRIVNISVAGPHDPLMEKAVHDLSGRGMIFVAAAGNEGPNAPPMYPAAYDSVIAVTAIARDLRSFRNANRGKYIDVAAPGVDIWTAMPGAKESFQSGTSFAVPFVTAVLAATYRRTKSKTKDGLLKAISYKDLGAPGRDPIFGRGLVQAPTGCDALPGQAPPLTSTPPMASVPAPVLPVGASGVGLGLLPAR